MITIIISIILPPMVHGTSCSPDLKNRNRRACSFSPNADHIIIIQVVWWCFFYQKCIDRDDCIIPRTSLFGRAWFAQKLGWNFKLPEWIKLSSKCFMNFINSTIPMSTWIILMIITTINIIVTLEGWWRPRCPASTNWKCFLGKCCWCWKIYHCHTTLTMYLNKWMSWNLFMLFWARISWDEPGISLDFLNTH